MAEESGTNAVLEEEAGVTSEESRPSTETPTAEKEGEQSSEKTPEKGKSSQETPSPDDSKDKLPPFHEHPRWKEVTGENKEMKATLSALAEMGIKSKEDAEFLLKDAETAKEEAIKEGHTKGRQELTEWIVSDPQRFRETLHKEYPEAFSQIVRNDVFSFAAAIAGSDKELADKIVEAAQGFFRESGSNNGRKAPDSPDKVRVSQELTAIQQEKQDTFDEQVDAENSGILRSTLTELTKGLAFQSDKQKERVFKNIFEGVGEALDKNPIFTKQRDKLQAVAGLPREQLRERRRELVQLYKKYTTDPSLLARLIEEERTANGIALLPKNGKATEAHTEVNGSGAPPNGKLTQADKDRLYEELEKKGYTGTRLTEAYSAALSKAKLGL